HGIPAPPGPTPQSFLPVTAETPQAFQLEYVTTWRSPSRSTRIGEPDMAEPPSSRRHLTSPVFASKAVRPPVLAPSLTQMMHRPSATSGELPMYGAYLVSLRHSSFPDLASRHERMPVMPRVKTLPSATAGVDRGRSSAVPSPPPTLYGAGYGSDRQF